MLDIYYLKMIHKTRSHGSEKGDCWDGMGFDKDRREIKEGGVGNNQNTYIHI